MITTATGATAPSQRALEDFADLMISMGTRDGALAILHDYAARENWARKRVAAAGHDWATHFARFDGTVTARRGED